MSKKKCPKISELTKTKLRFVDDYAKKTGDYSGDLMKVARWVYAEKLMDAPPYDPIKAIAKSLANACRQDYIENDNKEPVRRRHAYIPKGTESQGTFSWFKIEDATPEKMKLSAQGRRNGTIQDLLQLVRDVDYFNDKHNPGDPIQIELDFTDDIAELRMPDEYPDTPPGDDEDGPESPT